MTLDEQEGVELQRAYAASKTQQECKRFVHCPQLGRVQAAGRPTEARGVDHGRLLHQDARLLPAEHDRGAKARGQSIGGCGCDERGAQAQELVGLYDDRVACPALLMATGRARRGQAEHLPAKHLRPGAWSEPGHLLTDRFHLPAVVLIGGEALHLLPQRRANAPARSGLAQCRANGFGIRHCLLADHVERGGGGVIQADVDGARHRAVTVA